MYFHKKNIRVKSKSVKKGKKSQEKPEENTLEKEIDEMIVREKTKSKLIISAILHVFDKKSTVIFFI